MIHDNIPLPESRMQIWMSDYEQYLILRDRRLYLTTEIQASDLECDVNCKSKTMQLVEDILDYNRYDKEHNIPLNDRRPIRLYINSPGGDVAEGFSLISTIEHSKTPVYTINIGQWCSMAFLIGISGHKRLSLPYMRFLMHDGTTFAWDSGSKVQDKMDFNKRFSDTIIKKHVLKHSNMKANEYDALSRVEYYMLPEDALERNFIDCIIEDIDTIL